MANMYKVSSNLNNAYGSELDAKHNRNGPDMPQVTTNNRRMTNVKLSNGEYVQGIRKNSRDVEPTSAAAAAAHQAGGSMKPLRYTPGLACDAHLESLRPSRETKHLPLTSGSDGEWRKKLLVRPPQTYEGSFAHADMEQFRPVPAPPPPQADPWYASRVPEEAQMMMQQQQGAGIPAYDRLAGAHYGPGTSHYDQLYPQDELSRIKMRNRRFQNSCGQEMLLGGGGGGGAGGPILMHPQATMYGYGMPPMFHPMMMQQQQPMMQPQMMMMQQPQMPLYSMQQSCSPVLDDLQMIDNELNTTRRVTRPFVPSSSPEYFALQQQRDFLEEPTMPVRVKSAREVCPSSIEDLPAPKKPIPRGERRQAAEPVSTVKPRSEVKIADQIAIRSIVLGQNLSKIGGAKSGSESKLEAGL